MARVLIIGASRGIGLETVKAALAAGHSVRGLARSAQRIPVRAQHAAIGRWQRLGEFGARQGHRDETQN